MYGRVLTLHVRLEKKSELDRRILNDVLPVLRRSIGLLDFFLLQDEVELDKILIVSLWRSREDAERYTLTLYGKIKSILDPFLTFPPSVRTYTVNEEASGTFTPPQLKAEDLPASRSLSSKFFFGSERSS